MKKTAQMWDDTEYRYMRFVGLVNLALYGMFLLYGIPGIIAHEWTMQHTVRELLLLVGAFYFNLYVTFSSHQTLQTMSDDIDGFRDEMAEDIDYYVKRILRVVSRIYNFLLACLSVFEWVFTFVFGETSVQPLVEVVRGQSKIQTAEKVGANTLKGIHKAISKQMETTVTASKLHHERLLSDIRKNKVYLRRKSLINSPDT